VSKEMSGARAESRLPSVDFRPGIVLVRRCDACSAFDRRTWYATAQQAAERTASRSVGWSCRACAAQQATVVRAWFDSVYSEA
jgi:hypothetical protein